MVHEEDPFTYSCPSVQTLFPNNPSFAKTIRDGYKYLTGVGRPFNSIPVRCVCVSVSVCVHCPGTGGRVEGYSYSCVWEL